MDHFTLQLMQFGTRFIARECQCRRLDPLPLFSTSTLLQIELRTHSIAESTGVNKSICPCSRVNFGSYSFLNNKTLPTFYDKPDHPWVWQSS